MSEKEIKITEVSFDDFEELEEIVTPALGTGCTCNGSATQAVIK